MTTTAAPPSQRTPVVRAVIVSDEPPRIISGKSAWFQRWWVPTLILPMMMASDFKWRRRAAQEALGGSIDIQVLIELGVYASVALFLVLRHGRAPRFARTSNLLFALWAWAGIVFCSAFYSVYPKLGIVRGAQLMIVAILAQTIASHATVAHMHRLAHGYIIMLGAAVSLGYVWHGPLNKTVAGRFHWMYVHPVPAAMYLMCGLIIAAAYTRSAELRGVLGLWPRWVYGGLTAWIGLALVLTKTRGSIAGAAVALPFLLVFHTRSRTKVAVAVVGLLSLIAIVAGIGPAILAYLERGNSAAQLATLNDRTNLWASAIQKFTERPLSGYGLGASRGIFLDSIGLGGGHNAFINVLVDQGLIGMTAFVSVLGLVLWQLARFRPATVGHRDALILMTLMVGLLVNSTTAEFMAVPANNASILLFVVVAWTAVLVRAQKSVDAAGTT